MLTATLVLGAYLLGSVPFGLLIGRAHGVDIRTRGSHNIGATNVGRVIGRKWGFLCLALDIAKGFVPALTASLLLMPTTAGPHAQLAVLAVAVAAVLGHVFPIYLGFKGGKGVATTIGVAAGVWPYYTISILVALVAYAVVRRSTGAVSAGSLALAIVFPLALFGVTRAAGLGPGDVWPLQTIALLLSVVIIARHRENIRRLWRGEEAGIRGEPPGPTEPTEHTG